MIRNLKNKSFSADIIFFCSVMLKGTTSIDIVEGNLPDPFSISRIINTFVGPIMRTLPGNKLLLGTQIDETVSKVIQQKVAELRFVLQDNDFGGLDDSILFEGEDDTTILEFLPKTEDKTQNKEEKIKANLKKYKKIREKINRALRKETVSDKTKNLVIKTIDDLLKTLVGSQCKWKRTFRAEEPNSIADRWNEGLAKVKAIINDLFRNKTDNRRRDNTVAESMDNLQILFRTLAKDVDMISKRYKIQCEFVPKRQPNQPKPTSEKLNALRNNWDKTDIEDERCHNVYICSDELKEFMSIFYHSLKETSVNVIKNYAEMYLRDVVPDDEQKQTIVTLLRKVTHYTEDIVSEIFVKETKNLELNKNKNKDANIDALSNYVRNIIRSVKENITYELSSEIQNVSEKIKKVIEDDLKVNIDVDLDNLEREFISKICTIFRLCNGKYGGRRSIANDDDKNNMYVQVKLTLNDDNTELDNFKRMLNAKNNIAQPIKGINVTRTTYVYNTTYN